MENNDIRHLILKEILEKYPLFKEKERDEKIENLDSVKREIEEFIKRRYEENYELQVYLNRKEMMDKFFDSGVLKCK